MRACTHYVRSTVFFFLHGRARAAFAASPILPISPHMSAFLFASSALSPVVTRMMRGVSALSVSFLLLQPCALGMPRAMAATGLFTSPSSSSSSLIDRHFPRGGDIKPRRKIHPLPMPSPRTELRILVRLFVALLVGGSLGVERRAANSLAGVRTFSLVSLGAATFMTTVLLAFPSSDPSRIAAAISSSVGFLGAGAMSKDEKGTSRGLTTATGVWLAAGLGVAAACGLYVLASAGAGLTVCISRYARFDSRLKLIRKGKAGFEDEDEEDDDDDERL